jgi:hypothetical protein
VGVGGIEGRAVFLLWHRLVYTLVIDGGLDNAEGAGDREREEEDIKSGEDEFRITKGEEDAAAAADIVGEGIEV